MAVVVTTLTNRRTIPQQRLSNNSVGHPLHQVAAVDITAVGITATTLIKPQRPPLVMASRAIIIPTRLQIKAFNKLRIHKLPRRRTIRVSNMVHRTINSKLRQHHGQSTLKHHLVAMAAATQLMEDILHILPTLVEE